MLLKRGMVGLQKKFVFIMFLFFVLFLPLFISGCGNNDGSFLYGSGGQQNNPVVKNDLYTGIGLQCIPAALYSNDSASDVVIRGFDFGSAAGKVSLSSGLFTYHLNIASWKSDEIVVSVNPQQLSPGTYNMKIVTSQNLTAQTQNFTILQGEEPLLSELVFAKYPTLGGFLPSMTFSGRNLVLDGGAPIRIYAHPEGGQPVELSVLSGTPGADTDTVITDASQLVLFKGSKISFYAVTSEESNIITVVPPAAAKIYALFVGVNDYEFITPLDYCVNDVEGMRAALGYGSSNGMWANAEITSLTDSQAKKAVIVSAIDSIAAKMKQGDSFFMYFSGHGSSADTDNPQPDTEAYICPVDAGDSADSMISSAELKKRLAGMPVNAQKILIFDSCFSGGFIGKNAISGNVRFFPLTNKPKDVIGGGGFRNIGKSVPAVFFATACKYNELSVEHPSFEHGIYTYYLLDALGADGSVWGNAVLPGESIIGFREMHDATDEVPEDNPIQHPQIFTSPEEINYPIKGNL